MTQLALQPINNPARIIAGLDVSETTKQDYKYRIGLFMGFVKDNGLNPDTFRQFKNYLASRNDIAIATKNKYLATAKVFLKEYSRKGLLPDITQNTKGFSQSKKHKRDGLNDEEIKKFADYLRDHPDTRLKAIVSLLVYQGLRQVEIARLDVEDLELKRKVAFVRGKGQDDKEPVDLHPETIKALEDYLDHYNLKSGALFVSHSHNHFRQRLTTRAIRELVKENLTKLNIDKTIHGFRHYFTTTLIKTYKGDLLEVAGYTRHKGLEMLQVYNDNIKKQADLPRYYKAFAGVSF